MRPFWRTHLPYTPTVLLGLSSQEQHLKLICTKRRCTSVSEVPDSVKWPDSLQTCGESSRLWEYVAESIKDTGLHSQFFQRYSLCDLKTSYRAPFPNVPSSPNGAQEHSLGG